MNLPCIGGVQPGCPVYSNTNRQNQNYLIRSIFVPAGSVVIPDLTGDAAFMQKGLWAIYGMRRPVDGQNIDYATFLLLIEAAYLTPLNRMLYNVLAFGSVNHLYKSPAFLVDVPGQLKTQNKQTVSFIAASGADYFIDFIDFSMMYTPC